MENNTNQNLTQSEVPSLEALSEFEKSIRWISSLQTDRAMKDLAKMNRVPESVRNVIETMALSKADLIKSLRLMDIRERALQASLTVDKVMGDWVKENPDYEVDLKAK